MDTLQLIVFELLKLFSGLYILLVALRFILQIVRADFYNPMSQFIVKATNPLLLPLRKIIPGLFGIDLASLVLIVILQLIAIQLLAFVLGAGMLPLVVLVGCLVYKLIFLFFNIYFFSLIIVAILSWIAPQTHNPVVSILHSITEPALKPIRQLIPPMGGLDFSVMIAGIILWILMTVVNNMNVFKNLKAMLGSLM